MNMRTSCHFVMILSKIPGDDGGKLITYNCVSHKTTGKLIFSSNVIQGIKIERENILVYGEKSLQILKWVSTSNGEFELEVIISLTNLDDLILDVTFMTDTKLVIGYAHNFVDIFDISDPLSLNCKAERRVYCETIVSLFSMLLSFDDTEGLTVYAGSALGKLIIWTASTSSSTPSSSLSSSLSSSSSSSSSLPSSSPILESNTGSVKQVFNDHEGVIFRIALSGDRSRLASVSDDRSVRIWCLITNQQLYCAWGHTARVWDVSFVFGDNNLIVTSSQDGTVRVWRVGEGCLSILRGHQLHVWRVIAVNLSEQDGGSDVDLISCGNDGTVKTWNLARYLISSPAIVDSTSMLIDIPDLPFNKINSEPGIIGGTIDEEVSSPLSPSSSSPSSSSHRNGVCSVHCDAQSEFAVIVMIDGTVWLINIQKLQINPLAPADLPSSGWRFIHAFDRSCFNTAIDFSDGSLSSANGSERTEELDTVAIADAFSDSHPISQTLLFRLVVGHPDSTVSHITVNSSSSASSKQKSSIFDVSVRSWNPFPIRTANTWFLRSNIVLTAAARGTLKIWELPSSYLHIGLNFNDPECPNLLLESATGKGNMATSCCLTNHDAASPDIWTLIVGDSKGGITVINALYSSNSSESSTNTATTGIRGDQGKLSVISSYILWTAHRPEPVSYVLPCNFGFYSSGHDGFVGVYQLMEHCSDAVIHLPGSSSTTSDSRIFGLTNRISCLPIKSPMKLIKKSNDKTLLVMGYTGNIFQLCDVVTGCVLMAVEGGSWRRPHDCVVMFPRTSQSSMSLSADDSVIVEATPRVIFVCPMPQQKSTLLSICDSQYLHHITKSTLPSFVAYSSEHLSTLSQLHSSLKNTLTLTNGIENKDKSCNQITKTILPSQFGVSGFGDTLCCATFLRGCSTECVVVGGEDGAIKVYSISNGLELVQESLMPKSVPIKTLSSCARLVGLSSDSYTDTGRSHDCGILIAAGGRLTYSLWVYTNSPGLDRQPLILRAYGSIWQGATQDHRILCSSSQAVRTVTGGVYLTAFGDSRGQVTFLQYDPDCKASIDNSTGGLHGNYGCSILCSFEVPGAFPVLCCDTVVIQDENSCSTIICVVGDTSGAVNIWLLSIDAENVAVARCLCQYSAHSVGTNCISMRILWPDSRDKHSQSTGRDVCSQVRFVICTGGDDQALTIAYGSLLIENRDSTQIQLSYLERCSGACSSALKGVKLLSSVENEDNQELYAMTVGCDQRLLMYKVNLSDAYFSASLGDTLKSTNKLFVPIFRSIYSTLNHDKLMKESSLPRPFTLHAGMIANIGDISGLETITRTTQRSTSSYGVVVGQGFQLVSFE